MINFIARVALGYMVATFCYKYDPQFGDCFFYPAVLAGITRDNAYVAFQEFNNPFAVCPTLSLAQIEAQRLYTELLPSLGYDFLSQFDDVELLTLYSQRVDNNIEICLDNF